MSNSNLEVKPLTHKKREEIKENVVNLLKDSYKGLTTIAAIRILEEVAKDIQNKALDKEL